jgi:hypothetical protein
MNDPPGALAAFALPAGPPTPSAFLRRRPCWFGARNTVGPRTLTLAESEDPMLDTFQSLSLLTMVEIVGPVLLAA